MYPKRLAVVLLFLLCWMPLVSAQEKAADEKKPLKNEAPEPRAKDGRKLLTALDLLKTAGVGSP